MSGLCVRVHTTTEAAEPDWATPGLAGYAFQSFNWLRAWGSTMGAAARVSLALTVVADAGGRVVLCLPLGVFSRGGVRTLAFLGGVVTDYNAPLVAPGFAATLDTAGVAALWRLIGAALPPHDIVRFDRMPATLDSPTGAGEPSTVNPLALLAGAVEYGHARSVALPATYEAFLAGLKAKFVADTRRRQRRMAEEGPVELTVADNAQRMQSTLDALFQMKSRRWQETRARDWSGDPAFRGFYQAVSAAGLPGGLVHGSLLTVGGTVVAVHWGMIYRARFYHLMLGWAAGDWMRYATGRLITDGLIRQAISAGVRVFDFTVGDEAYKQDWADAALPLLRYTAGTTWRGHAALALQGVSGRLRTRAKQVTWLRALVRRVLGRRP